MENSQYQNMKKKALNIFFMHHKTREAPCFRFDRETKVFKIYIKKAYYTPQMDLEIIADLFDVLVEIIADDEQYAIRYNEKLAALKEREKHNKPVAKKEWKKHGNKNNGISGH